MINNNFDVQTRVLHSKFDIETHKKTFINYLEVVICEDGTIEYAVPSHQEKLIAIATDKLGLSRNELFDMCPAEYMFAVTEWLCKITGCVSVWGDGFIGETNALQSQTLKALSLHGLYKGSFNIQQF